MEEAKEFLKNLDLLSTLIIIVPWVFASLTLFLSYKNSKDVSKNAMLNINKTVLSENRQAWINTVRETISEYMKVHTALDNQSTGEAATLLIDDLVYLQTKIILLLNPLEKESDELVKEIAKITKPADKRTDINTNAVKANILILTQGILKKEWERVKTIS